MNYLVKTVLKSSGPTRLEEKLNEVTQTLRWNCIQILDYKESWVLVFERSTR